MHDLLVVALGTLAGCLLLAGVLHALPKVGLGSLGAKCAEAPLLDVIVFVLCHGGMVAGVVLGWLRGPAWAGSWGWALGEGSASLAGSGLGLVAGSVGHLVALWAWCRVHELWHIRVMKRPRIKGSLAKILSSDGKGGLAASWRNYLGVWWTLWAVPIFTFIRIGELTVYPIVSRFVRLPRYREREWVRVSRQKFEGLVGADRIWCLYCDWMTGVWSLGSEMLRNIESFWCPIRFASDAKCTNCVTDFPDLDVDWVAANGRIEDVAALIEKKYPGPTPVRGGPNSHSTHPSRGTVVRLTVRGEERRGG